MCVWNFYEVEVGGLGRDGEGFQWAEVIDDKVSSRTPAPQKNAASDHVSSDPISIRVYPLHQYKEIDNGG